jgi:hypothetical protein
MDYKPTKPENSPNKPSTGVARRVAMMRMNKTKLAEVDAKYMKLADAQERKLVDFESKAEEAAYQKQANTLKKEWNAARYKLGAGPSNKW